MKNVATLLALLLSLVTVNKSQEANLFPVKVGGKAGFINNLGRVIIKPQFEEAWSFSEGLATVRIGEDWGYIDQSGKIVIKPQFFQADGFTDGIAPVGVWYPKKKVIDDKVGYYSYIDKSGHVITNQRFAVAFGFAEDVANVLTEDSKHGFIDKSGNILFYFYTYGTEFRNGLALFKTEGNMPNSRAGYIDKSGKIVIPAIFRDGEDFSEGLACVYNDKGAGYIDTRGKVVIDFKFKYCRSFSEGLAAVYTDEGYYGFIDKLGTMVIRPKFAEVQPFSDGVAVVRVAEDKKSIEQEPRFKAGKNIVAIKSGAFGVIDQNGNFVIAPRFTQIGDFHNGLAWVNLSDVFVVHGDVPSWGYINKKCEIVWRTK